MNTLTPNSRLLLDDLLDDLSRGFEGVDGYFANDVCAHLRIVDGRFSGLSLDERLAILDAELDDKPDHPDLLVTFAALLAPGEVGKSPQDREYHAHKPACDEGGEASSDTRYARAQAIASR